MLDTDEHAYLTDFGLAKVRDASVLTKPGQALGSMDYMAPEQIRGNEVSACTDVYALGCVVYECLAGKPPFADRAGNAGAVGPPPGRGRRNPVPIATTFRPM